jgi:hypothetical protein
MLNVNPSDVHTGTQIDLAYAAGCGVFPPAVSSAAPPATSAGAAPRRVRYLEIPAPTDYIPAQAEKEAENPHVLSTGCQIDTALVTRLWLQTTAVLGASLLLLSFAGWIPVWQAACIIFILLAALIIWLDHKDSSAKFLEQLEQLDALTRSGSFGGAQRSHKSSQH